jgi:hypothetical protein
MALNFRAKAENRARLLWEYYDKNGSLSLSEFKGITGGQYESVSKTFETYGIKTPPVWDSRKEKNRRKALVLNGEAERLKQDHLTMSQAAKVLKVKANRVIGIEGRILRYGFEIPEIRVENKIPSGGNDNDGNGKMHGTINPLIYPSGLHCVPLYFNPVLNEIHYLVI